MIILWGRLNSHNVKKVAWFAEELGIAYERRDVGGQFGMDDAYRALNPNALIPTIEDGDLVLWESNAILRYLAARYGGERFWPNNAVQRAVGDKWMDWQAGYADAQRGAFFSLVRLPAEARDQDVIAQSVAASTRLMHVLDATLAQQPWLSGEEFGIGDIPMGVYAHSYFAMDIPRPHLPNVEDWYDLLKQRRGYAEQVMIPLT